MVTKPVTLPKIRRLTPGEVDALAEGLADAIYTAARKMAALPDHMLGAYQLPRGSVFIGYPQAPWPFAFTANLEHGFSGRAFVVVAREYGDLAFPVHMRQQRLSAAADVKAQSADIFRGLFPRLEHSQRLFRKEGFA